jgi:hypothetical protein
MQQMFDYEDLLESDLDPLKYLNLDSSVEKDNDLKSYEEWLKHFD